MPRSQDELLDIFKKSGAFLEGHFILTSGLHSPHYIEKFRVLEHPHYTAELCAGWKQKAKLKRITGALPPGFWK